MKKIIIPKILYKHKIILKYHLWNKKSTKKLTNEPDNKSIKVIDKVLINEPDNKSIKVTDKVIINEPDNKSIKIIDKVLINKL